MNFQCMCVKMDKYVWSEAILQLDVWKFVMITSGAQYVMMHGGFTMPEWSADNLDYHPHVRIYSIKSL